MTDLIPIAIRTDLLLGRFIGAFRVLEDGIGTDEVLYCETPIRNTRSAAIADAINWMAAQ
jgi:hypothetical protein